MVVGGGEVDGLDAAVGDSGKFLENFFFVVIVVVVVVAIVVTLFLLIKIIRQILSTLQRECFPT